MSNNNNNSLLTGLLLIAFIVLKLCKVIDWSWWWVLSPLWIPVVLAGAVYGIYALYLFVTFKKK